MSQTRIDLLRHGDTGQRSYRGQNDDPLTATGWEQVRAAVAGRSWDRIVSSTLCRCADFARELAQVRGWPLRLDERLVEYHFGDWQGVPIESLNERVGPALGRFWADPVAHPPPGAEAHAAFCQRVSIAMDQILEQARGERVLVVTHGGVIRLLRCLVEGRSFGGMANIEVPNASIHHLPWPPPLQAEPKSSQSESAHDDLTQSESALPESSQDDLSQCESLRPESPRAEPSQSERLRRVL